MKNIIIILACIGLLSACKFNLPSESDRCIGQPIQGSESVIFADKSERNYTYCGDGIATYVKNNYNQNVLTLGTTEFHREDLDNNVGNLHVQITSQESIETVSVLETPGYGYNIQIFLEKKSITNFKAEEIALERRDSLVSGTIVVTFNDVDLNSQQATANKLTLHLENLKINE